LDMSFTQLAILLEIPGRRSSLLQGLGTGWRPRVL
jgi:hypothetical protein